MMVSTSDIFKLELDAAASAASHLRAKAKMLLVSDDFASISDVRGSIVTEDISGDFDRVLSEYEAMPLEIKSVFFLIPEYIAYGRSAQSGRDAGELAKWYLKFYENTQNMRHDYWVHLEGAAKALRSQINSVNGKKGAEKRFGNNEGRAAVDGFVQGLASLQDWLGYVPVRELWPKFWSLLDEGGLNPKEARDEKRYFWDGGDAKGLSFKGFQNRIALCRSEGVVKK